MIIFSKENFLYCRGKNLKIFIYICDYFNIKCIYIYALYMGVIINVLISINERKDVFKTSSVTG